MINRAFGMGVAGPQIAVATSHATHTAASAAARKHRAAAAATGASVDRSHP